jgi:hypothetical protein
MATIILSAVGYVVGGAPGAAIGSLIGQQVDQRLFAPKARQGPRLNDLKVQTSSYGTPIPKVFGTMRLSGTVIWATDLREERRKVSNGKNAPKSTVYSYSASFAVALSARPVGRIGRIWADGKLLRGVAGDFKTPTGFRFYSGTEAQSVDPLIAAAEGASGTPAYRGISYAVFDGFQLADYGNRIPSLSFEVIADEGDITIDAVLNGLDARGVRAQCATTIGGFAAYGTSIGAVFQTLRAAAPFYLVDDGQKLIATDADTLPRVVPMAALGVAANRSGEAEMHVDQESASLVPARVALSYFDPARDYQASVQQARRDGGSRREVTLELAATLAAGSAKYIAEAALALRWTMRRRARIRLPWRYADIRPGDRLTIDRASNAWPDIWRVTATSFEKMAVSVDLVRSASAPIVVPPATAGRGVAQVDVLHGPTQLVLLDSPLLGDAVATKPRVAIAAAGSSPGWRGAALMHSVDDGVSWQETGTTAPPAIMGQSITPLAKGPAHVIDAINSVDIQLLHSGMALNGADDESLLSGSNLAMLGGELLQFGIAQSLGNGVFRLSRLLRGRRGSALQSHAAATPFVLLDPDALAWVDVPLGVPVLRVKAVGVGDAAAGVDASLPAPGAATRPLAPAHLGAAADGTDGFKISWVRQSRGGWSWVDGVDAPLAEERESYNVIVVPSVGPVRTVETATPFWAYTSAARATDIAAGSTWVQISVSQIGAFAVSDAATLTLSLV